MRRPTGTRATVHPDPPSGIFFAGTVADGGNLGLTRMAHATTHVAQSTLETTVNWCFSLEDLRRAHDAVVAQPGQLPVSRLFQRAPGQTPTSSDGRKYYVAVDSIHAAYSHKYFGQEMRFKHLGKASAPTGSGMTGTGSFTRPRSRPPRGKPLAWLTDSPAMRWWRPPFTAPTRTALLRATSP